MIVRDHIPLEQGLRPANKLEATSDRSQRPYSIRTRIKTQLQRCRPTERSWRQRPYSIRTRIKTFLRTGLWLRPTVRDHIPLEQGLRPLGERVLRIMPEESETIFH